MPKFYKRHINRQTLKIMRITGRTIALYLPLVQPSIPRVPDDINTAGDPSAIDLSNHTLKLIFAQFDGGDAQEQNIEGTIGLTTGTLYVPMLYKAYLDQADYINPLYPKSYLFVKAGASSDEEDLYISQTIKAVANPNLGEVS